MAAAALPPSFASFGLDDRLTRAVLKAKYTKPTLVQATAIPIALEGRDVLCRAKTGSGKTVAYSLPVLQKILVAKSVRPSSFVGGWLGGCVVGQDALQNID